MKLTILSSALAAAAIAASPVPAGADVSVGVSANNGRVAGHIILADHERHRRDHRRHDRRHGRHGPRGRHGRHGRFARCETWRFAHRKLHRRYGHVRLLRTVHNRRGARIFIAHARSYRGRPVRVRYNACLGRVMKVTPLRYHPRRGWRR